MARQVREYRGDEKLRTRVRQIMADAGVPSGDYVGEVRAVWDFVCRNIRYQHDPLGIEHITGPRALDDQIDEGYAAEDCESIVAYAATLFAANGTWSEFEIYGFDPGQPDKFTHVALAVRPHGSRAFITFDPVGACHRQGFGLGDTVWKPGLPIERWSLEGRKVKTPTIALSSRGQQAPSTSTMSGAAKGPTMFQQAYTLGFGDVDPLALVQGIRGAIDSGLLSAANIYSAVNTAKPGQGGVNTLTPAQLAELQRQQAAGHQWWNDPKYRWILYAGAALLAAKALRVI